jgi:TatD DNase family protein
VTKPTFIDSHVNLHHEQYADDQAATIARAREAGVGAMLTICDTLENFECVQAIAEANADIWCSVGVHPHYAKDYSNLTSQTLVELSEKAKVIGIGECGLDRYYEYSPIEDQLPVFRAHVAASRETQLPIIIHTRDVDEIMGDVLEEEFAKGAFPILLHCYTSGTELARRALALGAYFSMSGIMTFKAAESVRAVALELPLDRVIVETDCPYLSPIPYRGRRNEPAYVKEVLAFFAELRGLSFDDAARQTTDNFYRLFQRAHVKVD